MAQLNAACRDKFSGHDELKPRNPLQFPQHSLDGSLCRHAELAHTGHLRVRQPRCSKKIQVRHQNRFQPNELLSHVCGWSTAMLKKLLVN